VRLLAVVLAGVLALGPALAEARTKRDPAQRAAFQRACPCPANGRTRGACPGWVVDHVVALKRGGIDHPVNMQWQTVEDARRKDRVE
jgi:hypothetical protein